ncbi:MAG: hypothetical protein SFT94_02275 [Pseudanabaenaceae cyanobacterium bins.68]|nr:hypothetical protein [Pseudanabaenaceae cyanobacterium bins.68]
MAPRLSRPPNPQDPAYQRLENRINFGLHCAAFAAVNSSMWFFKTMLAISSPLPILLTSLWLSTLVGHGLWVGATQKILDQKIQQFHE